MPTRSLLVLEKFNADVLAREFAMIGTAVPPEGTAIPFDGPPPAGVIVFSGPANTRLILQYEIQNDSFSARFSMLIETPDAD